MRSMPILTILLAVSAGLTAGCGGSDHSASSTAGSVSVTALPSTPAPAPELVIENFGYAVTEPLRAGQQVLVVNDDQPSHSVTAETGGLFDIRVSGGGGVSTFVAPTMPGTYPFHCKYHAGMHGSLTVQ